MTTAVIKYEQKDLKKACRDVLTGKHQLVVSVTQRADRLSDINIAGMTLLKECFDELGPKEVSFLGNMYAHKYEHITPKQYKYLNDLLGKYLDLTLEAFLYPIGSTDATVAAA